MPGLDLTEGHVGRRLLRFSAPIMLSMLLQSLYGLVDMVVVGQFCTEDLSVMSGVTIGAQITLILTNLVSGFAQGGSVLIAQYKGARLEKDEREAMGTLFTFFTIAGVALTAVMLLLRVPMLNAVSTAPSVMPHALDYTTITLGGTVFIVGYNAVSAVLRGLGDSKSPLIFVAIATVISIVLDLVFVGIFGWGAAGAAWSTIIAQAAAFIFAVASLRKRDFAFKFKLSHMVIVRDKLRLLLKIGLPSSAQSTLVSLSFLTLTALVNERYEFGASIIGVGGRVNAFAILPNIAMNMAVASMVAQNIGARQYDRAKLTLRSGIGISLIFAAFVIALVNIFPAAILRIFSPNEEILQGIAYLRIMSIDYIATCFSFCLMGLLTGAGRTTFTMINAICGSWLFRAPLAMLLIGPMGIEGAGLATVLATVGQMAIAFIYYKTGRWMTSIAAPIESSTVTKEA